MLPKWPKIIWLYSNKKNSPYILGINPWIYDFAAFNLWSRPLGLIVLLSYLYRSGANVALLDCMYKMWQDVSWPKSQVYGTSHYPRVYLPKPYFFKDIPRRFARYGLPLELVKKALKALNPPPDLVLVTSIMTYWYPGVVVILNLIKEIWPKVPVIVGGIYATLCFEHAQKMLDAYILKGPVEIDENQKLLSNKLGLDLNFKNSFDLSIQADLYLETPFAVLMLNRGCPFGCDYCASKELFPKFLIRSYEDVFREFEFLYKRGIRNFAFYDDALLVNWQNSIGPFLEMILKKGIKDVNFHVPNGLHVRFLSKEVCELLKRAGFKTIRLGLETVNFKNRWDKKLTYEEWDIGVKNLISAGFKKDQLGAYILFGLPEQEEKEVVEAINFVKRYGIRPHLAYYSPIPKTKLFEVAKKVSFYPLEEEPLTHNRSIWPCYKRGFSWEERSKWRSLLKF